MVDGKSVISFRALQIANEQRTAYGLRYNDFTRYRRHCAHRTHRLRSILKLTHGKGREFKKLPPITDENIKDGHLQLLLFEVERAWAYAQELISLSTQPSNGDRAKGLRQNAGGRFRRAIRWSAQLLSHCQSLFAAARISAEDLLQAHVYNLVLNGRFLRYREEFEDAVVRLSVAKALLDHLAQTATTSRDQALATLFGDEIGPEIRHCAHELGRSKAYDIDGIVAELAPKFRNEVVENYDALLDGLKKEQKQQGGSGLKKLRQLLWEGQTVPVRNPELVDVLLRVQEGENKLAEDSKAQTDAQPAQSSDASKGGHSSKSKKGVSAFDAILLALSDAETVARRLVEVQQASGSGSSSTVAGVRDIHFVHAYITYQLLSRRTQRDLLLVSSLLASQQSARQRPKLQSQDDLKKKQKEGQVDARLYPAVVKMLDTVVQSLEQMRTLSIVDDSPDLGASIEARLSFTKAQRCHYLARCYAAVKKYAESLALIQHTHIYLRETRSSLSLFDVDPITSGDQPSYYELDDNDLVELESALTSDGARFKREWFAYNGGSVNPDEHASFKKPLFFDIALNYAQLDMDRLLERAGKKPKEASTPAVVVSQEAQLPSSVEKKSVGKVKVEVERTATPEPAAPARGGLGSLLGGWWGRG